MQRVWEEGGGGHNWNSGETSGSNLDRGMQERGNGFRLLLFALVLRFVRNESSCHMTHTVSFSLWISHYWPTAYWFSSIHEISMGHYPDPSTQTQNICPAESGEASWPPQWETVFTTAERLFGLKELKICWLWSYQEDVFSLSKDNARALTRNSDPSACCAQEINKMWWNEWGNAFCFWKHHHAQHSEKLQGDQNNQI